MSIVLIALLTGCEQNTGKSAGILAPTAEMTPMEKVCSRAYTGRDGARSKAMKALTEEQQADVPAMPDKDQFIELCKVLDEDAARCLDPNILQVDIEGCTAAFEAADKSSIEKLNALLLGQPVAEDKAKEEAGDDAEAGEEGDAGDAKEGSESGDAKGGGAGNLVQDAMKQGG